MTSIELQHLGDRSEPGKTLVVDGVLGGVERRLVLLASAPVVGRGAVLAVVPEDAEPPSVALELAAQLWHILSTDAGRRATDPSPDILAGSLAGFGASRGDHRPRPGPRDDPGHAPGCAATRAGGAPLGLTSLTSTALEIAGC